MDWVTELREKFEQVRGGGGAVSVSFAARPDLIGELGREFNALAGELAPIPPPALTREQAHSLRNHLAGLLAALHVLKEGGTLSADEQQRLAEVVEEARALDTSLRARVPGAG